MRRANGNGIALDVLKGVVAGAAATWLMNQATIFMYERESEAARNRENEARGGGSAYQNAADRLAAGAGVALSDEQRNRAASGIHWATGIAAGVAYALLRRRAPTVAAAQGLAFGTTWYLLVDEFMNPALGLTPGPRAFPWQTHARGFGGHAAFGLTNELVLKGLDRIASSRAA